VRIRLLIIMSLIFLQCARSPLDSPAPDAGEPLSIDIEAPAATFTAPEHPDTVTIRAQARREDGAALAGTATIVVYRQWAVLKANDFRYVPSWTVSRGWRRYVDFVSRREIRTSLGLIGKEIERGDSSFATMIRDLAADHRYEFWNHGYDHAVSVPDSLGRIVSEFRGTSYEHQLDHLRRTQELAREECGIALCAFGAPGNAFDANTVRALDACPDIRIWLFGPEESGKLVLPRTIPIEQPIFNPDFAAFLTAYDPEPPFAVYQIHPKDWDETRFGEFARIVDFLLDQEVTFVTPSELERFLEPERIP